MGFIRRRRRAPRRPLSSECRGHHFLVDAFFYSPPSTRYYFLSHFHSDHYGGLDSSFDAGIVVCNAITGRLVQSQLRVPSDRILTIAEYEIVKVGTHRVVALPANHCPGAVIFLFFVGGGKVHLHTGDFRYCDSVRADVQRFLGGKRIDALLLDTTYASPQHTFPPQRDCIDALCDYLDEIARTPRALVVFGAYTIGKERMYVEAARRLGAKIAVSASKMRILRQLDWSPQDLARLTVDKSATRVWVVPMSRLRFDELESHLKSFRRYT